MYGCPVDRATTWSDVRRGTIRRSLQLLEGRFTLCGCCTFRFRTQSIEEIASNYGRPCDELESGMAIMAHFTFDKTVHNLVNPEISGRVMQLPQWALGLVAWFNWRRTSNIGQHVLG